MDFLTVVMLFLREYTFLAATAEFLVSLPSEREPFMLSFCDSLLRSINCSVSREGGFRLVLLPLAVKYYAAL